ncbi:MAG: hypothetical protein U0002_01610 [Thermoanaerobaculia bacterium]
MVNRALEQVVERWQGPPSEYRFAVEVYRILGGLHWVDHIERLAMKSRTVDKLPQTRFHSIFRGAPFTATRTLFVFGVGRTIRLAGSLVGSDKLGHFISQGLKYYRSYRAGWSEDRILGRGRFNERWLFGQWTTGVYSNADLVANYEGYRFYRSLFEDDIVPGKKAIVTWRWGRPHLARPFDWADHVNDYWDEALNPSHFGPGLGRFMHRRLVSLCSEEARDPAQYVPREEAALKQRYARLGMRDGSEFRLDVLCGRAALAQEAGR